MEKKMILHITFRTDWEQALQVGAYSADSLQKEGFIHCSTPEQVLGAANTHYKGEKDLVILWIDPTLVAPEIRWELSDRKIYPHIYGPLNLTAVIRVFPFPPNEDGVFDEIPV